MDDQGWDSLSRADAPGRRQGNRRPSTRGTLGEGAEIAADRARLLRRAKPRRFVSGALAALAILHASIGRAQAALHDSMPGAPRDSLSPSRRSPSPPPAWITKRELVIGGLSAAATLAMFPVDHRISDALQDRRWQSKRRLHGAATALAFLGGPGPFVLGAGFYGVGSVARSTPLTDIGVHLTEGVLLAASLTALGKGFAGRALPGVETPHSFVFGRGFQDDNGPYVSFPSGHTAAGFAMAAVLTGETAHWAPAMTRYVAPITYVTAGCIALARVYQHAHWPSDLPLAAAIGTWSGVALESHVHARAGDRVSRVLRAASVVPTGRGVVVAWSSTVGAGDESP